MYCRKTKAALGLACGVWAEEGQDECQVHLRKCVRVGAHRHVQKHVP